MVALCSKTYVLKSGHEIKLSCKGINKDTLTDPLVSYQKVLETEASGSGCNRGFRARGNTIFTYEQTRSGLSSFYCKRRVLDDGVSTVPLNIELSPWKIPPYIGFEAVKHPLGNDYPSGINIYGQCFENATQAYQYKLRLCNKLNDDVNVSCERNVRLQESWFVKRDGLIKEILIEKMHTNEMVRHTLLLICVWCIVSQTNIGVWV